MFHQIDISIDCKLNAVLFSFTASIVLWSVKDALQQGGVMLINRKLKNVVIRQQYLQRLFAPISH